MSRRVIALLCCLYPGSQLHAWASPPPFEACTDYHCDILKPVTLRPDEWREIRGLFSATRSAVEERQQIRAAIARFEQLVGEQTDNWRDLPENDGEGSESGQLDCIAESINTTTYLQLMARDNLLKWHRVEERQRRNPWLFNIHWTATLMDIRTRQQYAVDSWFFANGQAPVIQPIEAWLSGQDFRLK
jgi:hypothetical protein